MYGIAHNKNADFPERKLALFRLKGYQHIAGVYPDKMPEGAFLINELCCPVSSAESRIISLRGATKPDEGEFLSYLNQVFCQPGTKIYLDNLEAIREVPGLARRTVGYYTYSHDLWGAITFHIHFATPIKYVAYSLDGSLKAICNPESVWVIE